MLFGMDVLLFPNPNVLVWKEKVQEIIFSSCLTPGKIGCRDRGCHIACISKKRKYEFLYDIIPRMIIFILGNNIPRK
jgi:hypothetical protein